MDEQKIVSTLSDFIYVDTGDTPTKETKTGSSSVSVVNKEQELEDQLMALGERWTVLCNWVEHRANLLEIAEEEVNQFSDNKADLVAWIDKTEIALKKMEQDSFQQSDQSLDASSKMPLIMAQMKQLKVGQSLFYSNCFISRSKENRYYEISLFAKRVL